MRLPTKEEFDAVRFALWNVFEIVLMVIAMCSIVLLSLKHIPTMSIRSRRLRKNSCQATAGTESTNRDGKDAVNVG
jgi:hypothetical protein